MHAQEHGRRNECIDEVIGAEDRVPAEPEREHGEDRRHRHRRHAEEQLARQADQEDEEPDVRRQLEGLRDLLTPADRGRAGDEQAERKEAERKRRGIEDVNAASVLVPANELLGEESDRHHQELEVEPVRLEPQEQVDAENDRKRTESERVRLAARPPEQDVEGIGEQKLGGEKVERVVHLAPVPAPIQHDRELRAGLQIVLLAQVDFQHQ
jgi:hypothetical protein